MNLYETYFYLREQVVVLGRLFVQQGPLFGRSSRQGQVVQIKVGTVKEEGAIGLASGAVAAHVGEEALLGCAALVLTFVHGEWGPPDD